jgi:hypothetical protein
MFRHPKYYKELRKLRNKLDQAISEPSATAQVERAPDPRQGQATSFLVQDQSQMQTKV